MLPLKAKIASGVTKSVGVSKFKVYSENSKANGRGADSVDVNSAKTSVLSKRHSLLTNSTDLKAEVYINDAEETKCSHEPLGNVNVGRKALADVSNIRRNSSRSEKPGGSSHFRNSMSVGALNSTASSGRPPMVKVKAITNRVLSASQSKGTANNKTVRTSSSFGTVELHDTIHNLTRQTSTSNRAIARNSLPVIKKPLHLRSSDVQVNTRSAEKSSRKIGFPVKTKLGGVSNLQSKVMKARPSDGLIRMPQKNENKDALRQLRNSVKPVARASSQTSSAQRNSKTRRTSILNNSLGTTSAKMVKGKVVASSIHNKSNLTATKDEVTRRGNANQCSAVMKPEIPESIPSRVSRRRKSYTSSLLSRSEEYSVMQKLGQNIEVQKQEDLPNIDDEGNPLEVAEYVDDIYEYYWVMEAQSTSLENYLMIQTEITPQMRSILVNWLVEVHFKFDLMPETLYLAVSLLDRYLSLSTVKRRQLQLVGLTSLLLASKYEDFWQPRVKDLISISAEAYTSTQILEMEMEILRKLKFRLNLPTAYVFMLRFLKASQSEKQLEHLAFYLIELCLVEYEALKFRPSLFCASAVYLARCTLKKLPAWTPLLGKHAHYNELEIRECAEMMLRIHQASSSNVLKVTYDKYKQPEFGGVTSIKPLDSLP